MFPLTNRASASPFLLRFPRPPHLRQRRVIRRRLPPSPTNNVANLAPADRPISEKQIQCPPILPTENLPHPSASARIACMRDWSRRPKAPNSSSASSPKLTRPLPNIRASPCSAAQVTRLNLPLELALDGSVSMEAGFRALRCRVPPAVLASPRKEERTRDFSILLRPAHRDPGRAALSFKPTTSPGAGCAGFFVGGPSPGDLVSSYAEVC